MQISRHWRMNGQRYRLEGVLYGNGALSLQDRPVPLNYQDQFASPAISEETEEERFNKPEDTSTDCELLPLRDVV